jgi:gas vesicle protein
VVDAAGNVGKAASKALDDSADAIVEGARDLASAENVSDAAEVVARVADEIGDTVTESASDMAGKLADAGKKVGSHVLRSAEKFAEEIKEAEKQVDKALEEYSRELKEVTAETVGDIVKATVDIAQAVESAIFGFKSSKTEPLEKESKNMGLPDNVKEKFDAMLDFVW